MNKNLAPTNIGDFADDLDAGSYGEKVAALISEIATSTVDEENNLNKQDGKLTLTFTFRKIGTTNVQLSVSHKIDAKIPTPHGYFQDIENKSTSLFVNPNGRVSFFLENQGQLFTKTGENAE